MLKKQNRLSKITKKKGDKLFTFPLFNLRISDNEEEVTRFAFIVSKKIDKRAVVRNRTKRVLRKAIEEMAGKVNGGKNIVIVSKKNLETSQKETVANLLEGVFKKTGIIK
jgi:ribonuclease P protein component